MKTKSPSAKTKTASASGTQTIQRAALLLRKLTSYNRTGLRLVDLAMAAELERPTAHRILQGLIAEEMVIQDRITKRYHLGPAMYEMGLAAAPRYQLRDICQLHLESVAINTGDTAFLTVRSGFDAVCLDRKEGDFPIKAFVLDIGRHRPLGIGAGSLALLSALSDDEVHRIISANDQRHAYSRETVTVAQLKARIAETRKNGFARSAPIQVAGIKAIGVAILNASAAPVGAISVSAVSARLTGAREQEVLSILRHAVANIEAAVHKIMQ